MKSINTMMASLDLGAASPRSTQHTSAVTRTDTSVRTSSITLISHAHGRQRREERDITKRELQEAIKYGRKERANPGRDGSQRWRFTHKGVIYITDESMKHEITSWRMTGTEDLPEVNSRAMSGSHTVLVVDCSGSMRKGDVPGYSSRTAAVYDCLARDFVEPQLAIHAKAHDKSEHVVTLIEMSITSKVIFSRLPFDESLKSLLQQRAHMRAASHGNYLPALDLVLDVLHSDLSHGKQIFLLFLSDGEPSDHINMTCNHGVSVWEEAPDGTRFRGRPALTNCPDGGVLCRKAVKDFLLGQCLKRVTRLGDLFGRDRTFVGTVAFGPPGEDYRVLECMAAGLPRGSFQKLGLNALHLRTAFSSLTDSLTTLCTDASAGAGAEDGARRTERRIAMEREGVRGSDGWDVYLRSAGQVLSKQRFDLRVGRLVDAAWSDGADGVAHSVNKFAEGAERVVFHCIEVNSSLRMVGPRLVAKQPRYEEQLLVGNFHNAFCRVQAEAQHLATLFNRRAQGPPSRMVTFLDCVVYHVRDPRFEGGSVRVLAEAELEGRYTKWNNNNGVVRPHQPTGAAPGEGLEPNRGRSLGAIGEASDDERGSSGTDGDESGSEEGEEVTESDVPQCFSHFSYEVTDGKKLVCDLQGVWNELDGFLLTDPVIHTGGGRRSQASRARAAGAGANGRTDKGAEGVRRFFATHLCNALCRRLGLRSGGAL